MFENQHFLESNLKTDPIIQTKARESNCGDSRTRCSINCTRAALYTKLSQYNTVTYENNSYIKIYIRLKFSLINLCSEIAPIDILDR